MLSDIVFLLGRQGGSSDDVDSVPGDDRIRAFKVNGIEYVSGLLLLLQRGSGNGGAGRVAAGPEAEAEEGIITAAFVVARFHPDQTVVTDADTVEVHDEQRWQGQPGLEIHAGLKRVVAR